MIVRSEMSAMRVTTASRKKRSCETRMTACGYDDEVVFEPVARVEIEMVRRLVEQQQRRPAEQQLGERDAHLPAAGERLGRLVEVGLREAQAFEHLRHAQVDAVPLLAPEELREVVVADEQRFVLAVGQRRVGQRVFDAIDLGACLEQRAERERRLVDQRAAGVLEAVLRQVADRQPGRLDDGPGVRLVEPGQHAEQGGLAGAVRAAEADAVAVGDRPGHVVEQDAFAERLREAWRAGSCAGRGARNPRDVLGGPRRDREGAGQKCSILRPSCRLGRRAARAVWLLQYEYRLGPGCTV